MLSVDDAISLPDIKHAIEDSSVHTIIILRGLPGSGKSTVAGKIKEMYGNTGNTVVICSADNYFMVDGSYKFNAEKLGEAHQACKDTFMLSVKSTEQKLVVVVDNTHSTCLEYAHYASTNLSTFVLEFACSMSDIEMCAARSVHQVPMAVFDRMFTRWEHDPKAILMSPHRSSTSSLIGPAHPASSVQHIQPHRSSITNTPA
jgi:tRNA uridine 5-carbamoylmethylation protein Kti12